MPVQKQLQTPLSGCQNMDNHLPVHIMLEHLAREREAMILNQLINKHRSGVINAQDALSGIAALSTLRLLVSDAEHKLNP